MNPQFWIEQFEHKARSPVSWVLQARRLKCAADLLFAPYVNDLRRMQGGCSPLDLTNLEIAGPATLFCGLAFENLFKAAIIKANGASIKNGKLKKWPGTGHNLIALADAAQIRLTRKQRDLLSRLTAYVEWGGRYPIPMSQDKMPLKQDGVSPEWFPLPVQPQELADVQNFLEKIEARVLG